MARLFPSRKFMCADFCCIEVSLVEGTRDPERDEDGIAQSIPVDMKVERYWLLRDGLPECTKEEECTLIDGFSEGCKPAVWADSEEHARAMYEEASHDRTL